jgi:hypothetical protein
MTIILIVTGVLFLVIAAIFSIGALLPKEHRAHADLVVALKPEHVWKLVNDPEQATKWRSDIVKSEKVSSIVICETDKRGKKMLLETTCSNPPYCLVRRIAESGLPFGGQWMITIEPEKEQSRVRIVEDGFVNPVLFRFISRFLIGYDRTIRNFLLDLNNYCNRSSATSGRD